MHSGSQHDEQSFFSNKNICFIISSNSIESHVANAFVLWHENQLGKDVCAFSTTCSALQTIFLVLKANIWEDSEIMRQVHLILHCHLGAKSKIAPFLHQSYSWETESYG